MTLDFELRPSYGHDRYYPVNVPALRLAALANRKSFTRDELTDLMRDGFTIVLREANQMRKV